MRGFTGKQANFFPKASVTRVVRGVATGVVILLSLFLPVIYPCHFIEFCYGLVIIFDTPTELHQIISPSIIIHYLLNLYIR